MNGIVSEHLTQRLMEDIRTKGLLVWLDKDGVYSDFVDRLAEKQAVGAYPYPVYGFRGSFVRLMRQSYPTLAGAELPRCVIHLPGFSEDSIKATPLYEAYKAGSRWRAALETTVREAGQGHLTPDQLDALIDRDDLSLEVADRYLADHLEETPALQALLSRHGEVGLLQMFLTDLPALRAEFTGDDQQFMTALLHRVERQLGLGEWWIEAWSEELTDASELSETLWAFLLCREYAVDMADTPTSLRLVQLRELPKQYHRAGDQVLAAIRRDHPDTYVTRSKQVVAGLTDEERSIPPTMLGKIDTFRFEAEIFVAEAFRLLDIGQWQEAAGLAKVRLSGNGSGVHTFWVARDPVLKQTWKWVRTAAALGGLLAIARDSEEIAESLSEQTRRYREETWQIDQLHRQFTLQSINLGSNGIDSQMAVFSRVQTKIRARYREWIDATISGWNAACERDGFLPEAPVRQRGFYQRYIAPAIRDGVKTALILADALRYELGRELQEQIEQEGIGVITVSALVAELPTITAVGMSALAPTEDGGALHPLFSPDGGKITGFRGGSRDVISPDSRKKTFAEVAGVSCEWQELNDFVSASEKDAARLGTNRLVILATGTVDKQGEGEALVSGIDYFDTTLSRIISAVRRLVRLGYQRIVITADHGFIIGDDTVQTAVAPKLEGVDRRHALGDPRFGEELVSVRMPELQYHGESPPAAIVFHRGSHILASRPTPSFYHGGNSPQERLIPVLQITTSGSVGHREPGTYRLEYEVLPDLMGQHRIKVTATELSAPALFDKASLDVLVSAVDDARVVIADVAGGTSVGDLITLNPGTPCEIVFAVRGSVDRSRLRFDSARPENVIENGDVPEYFDVEVTGSGVDAGTNDAGTSASWESVVDANYHVAIRHLQSHGAMTVRFLENSLGGGAAGARKARKFAIKVDDWRPYLPFRITIHDTPQGKEYRTS
jgi:hypothetical protein